MRVHALDTAKGLGILLVVFGHAWRGNYSAGVSIPAGVYEAVDRAIYSFHMPLFFFLAGLLFWETLNKRRFDVFVKERVVRLLWPLVLWTWIFVAIKLLAGQAANAPVGLGDVQLFPLPPYEHMWFLWALFLIQVAVAAGFALKSWTATPFRISAGIVGIALILALPFIDLQSDWFGAALQHTPYFLMALALGWMVQMRPPALIAGLAAVVFCGLVYLAGTGLTNILPSMVIVLCLCVVISYFDPGGETSSATVSLLRWLGQASMAIYLSHTIFSAGLREVLLSVGMTNAGIVIALTTMIGILVPVALYWVARSNWLGRVLGF